MALVSPTGHAILNTAWPEAYLPDSVAITRQISQLLYAAVLGAQVWEIVTTLHYDYKMLFHKRITLGTVAYMISRWGACTHTIGFVLFASARLHHGFCQKAIAGFSACYAIAGPATAMLFYLRAMALYRWQRKTAIILGVFWLATLGASIAAPFGLMAVEIADTKRCMLRSSDHFAKSPVIALFLNDTAVWMAVNARILFYDMLTGQWGWDVFQRQRREGLTPILAELFKQGTLYYGVVVFMNVLCFCALIAPNAHPIAKMMLAIPNLAITASMGGRIHRQMLFATTRPKSWIAIDARAKRASSFVLRSPNTPRPGCAQGGEVPAASLERSTNTLNLARPPSAATPTSVRIVGTVPHRSPKSPLSPHLASDQVAQPLLRHPLDNGGAGGGAGEPQSQMARGWSKQDHRGGREHCGDGHDEKGSEHEKAVLGAEEESGTSKDP